MRAELADLRHLSSRKIAQALNARGLETATGGQWSSKTVIRLIERLG
jgi:hypothetical protein